MWKQRYRKATLQQTQAVKSLVRHALSCIAIALNVWNQSSFWWVVFGQRWDSQICIQVYTYTKLSCNGPFFHCYRLWNSTGGYHVWSHLLIYSRKFLVVINSNSKGLIWPITKELGRWAFPNMVHLEIPPWNRRNIDPKHQFIGFQALVFQGCIPFCASKNDTGKLFETTKKKFMSPFFWGVMYPSLRGFLGYVMLFTSLGSRRWLIDLWKVIPWWMQTCGSFEVQADITWGRMGLLMEEIRLHHLYESLWIMNNHEIFSPWKAVETGVAKHFLWI